MRRRLVSAVVGIATVLGAGNPAAAQTFNSGSTGVDGAFAPAADVTVPLPPDGVLNFTTVSVPAGVAVKFARNAANTPVTVLASGDVTIAGTIDLSGERGGRGWQGPSVARNGGVAGPGGFDGGNGATSITTNRGGHGLGPGGGWGGAPAFGGGGGYATPGGNGFPWDRGGPGGATYGFPALLPLIGGSGGGGGGGEFEWTGAGGGGGGGAILIAASGRLTFTGQILARGGAAGGVYPETPGGGGSGGAVRLVATALTGAGGSVDVSGGHAETAFNIGGNQGGSGRIRLEAFTNTLAVSSNGILPSIAAPNFVSLPTALRLRIASVAGVAAPAAPSASFTDPDIALPSGIVSPVDVVVTANNVPVGTAVAVHVKGLTGAATGAAGVLSGTYASSSATITVAIPTDQPAVMAAFVTYTITAANGGPVFAGGEVVDRVRITAIAGGPARVAYVTRSGREIVVTAVAH